MDQPTLTRAKHQQLQKQLKPQTERLFFQELQEPIAEDPYEAAGLNHLTDDVEKLLNLVDLEDLDIESKPLPKTITEALGDVDEGAGWKEPKDYEDNKSKFTRCLANGPS